VRDAQHDQLCRHRAANIARTCQAGGERAYNGPTEGMAMTCKEGALAIAMPIDARSD